MTKDLYKILGVDSGASESEIKKAYRKIAVQNHPDRFPGDTEREERFREASEAYEVLGDEEKRTQYDQKRMGIGTLLSDLSSGEVSSLHEKIRRAREVKAAAEARLGRSTNQQQVTPLEDRLRPTSFLEQVKQGLSNIANNLVSNPSGTEVKAKGSRIEVNDTPYIVQPSGHVYLAVKVPLTLSDVESGFSVTVPILQNMGDHYDTYSKTISMHPLRKPKMRIKLAGDGVQVGKDYYFFVEGKLKSTFSPEEQQLYSRFMGKNT